MTLYKHGFLEIPFLMFFFFDGWLRLHLNIAFFSDFVDFGTAQNTIAQISSTATTPKVEPEPKPVKTPTSVEPDIVVESSETVHVDQASYPKLTRFMEFVLKSKSATQPKFSPIIKQSGKKLTAADIELVQTDAKASVTPSTGARPKTSGPSVRYTNTIEQQVYTFKFKGVAL